MRRKSSNPGRVRVIFYDSILVGKKVEKEYASHLVTRLRKDHDANEICCLLLCYG